MHSRVSSLPEVSADPGLLARPPVDWALHVLRDAVRRMPAAAPAGSGELQLSELQLREGGSAPAAEGAYELAVDAADGGVRVRVAANDDRGFTAAITELAARIADKGVLALRPGSNERHIPAVPIRGIQRSFSSVDEDLSWFSNRRFWGEYLDFLATQRFTRFHLALGMQYNYGADLRPADDNYFCFAYPFLLDVPGFEVRAQGLSDEERHRNLDQLRFIAAETARRGMDFQLGLWNHAWDYGKNHAGWGLPGSAVHRYPVLGVSRENHTDYCAAAVQLLLREVPDIRGLTFRVHFEGGIKDVGHEVFWGRMFEAVASAGRPVHVDLHAKGVDQAILDAVDRPGLEPILSAKYWAEHMGLPYHQAAIRQREQNEPSPAGHDLTAITEYSRRFTRYGYADFLAEDRPVDVMFRVWPGTQKLLLWGDPATAAGYARTTTIAGARGLDLCEPLYFKGRKGSGEPGGRDPYARADLRLGDDGWRKYRYTYAVWGRMLDDPDAPLEVTDRILREDHGELADAVRDALAPLSRILPLVTTVHGVGASNGGYWPELPVDLPISPWVRSTHYEWDTRAPATWGGVSPFDPELFFGVDEYVDARITGEASPKYTPLEVAAWLERFADEGEAAFGPVRSLLADAGPQSVRAATDLEVLSRLGRFYAGKLRAAVHYSVWERTGDRSELQVAITRLEAAHQAFADIVAVVRGTYRDDLAFGPEDSERGHWRLRLKDMETDLRALRRELATAPPGRPAAVSSRERRTLPAEARLIAPERFRRGEPLEITLTGTGAADGELRYRRLDQSARWAATALRADGDRLIGTIPAEATASAFPLMYYAVVASDGAEPVILPGFDEATLASQPYAVLHSDEWTGRSAAARAAPR